MANSRSKSKARREGQKTKKATTRKRPSRKSIPRKKHIRIANKSGKTSVNGLAKKKRKVDVVKRTLKKKVWQDVLTAKENKFVEEYCADFNGTMAARRAGYSSKTAGTTAIKLLAREDVKVAVRDCQKAMYKECKVTRERVMLELARMAFSDIANYVKVSPSGIITILPLSEIPPGARAAIHKVIKGVNGAVRYELYDKKAALDLIIRMNGWIVDRSDVSVNGTMNEKVQVYLPDNARTQEADNGGSPVEAPVGAPKPKTKKTIKLKHK